MVRKNNIKYLNKIINSLFIFAILFWINTNVSFASFGQWQEETYDGYYDTPYDSGISLRHLVFLCIGFLGLMSYLHIKNKKKDEINRHKDEEERFNTLEKKLDSIINSGSIQTPKVSIQEENNPMKAKDVYWDNVVKSNSNRIIGDPYEILNVTKASSLTEMHARYAEARAAMLEGVKSKENKNAVLEEFRLKSAAYHQLIDELDLAKKTSTKSKEVIQNSDFGEVVS